MKGDSVYALVNRWLLKTLEDWVEFTKMKLKMRTLMDDNALEPTIIQLMAKYYLRSGRQNINREELNASLGIMLTFLENQNPAVYSAHFLIMFTTTDFQAN